MPWVLKNVPSVRGSGMASAGVRPSPHSSTLLPTLSTAAAALGASPTEAATVSVYFRAVAALYGSILFWYGAWTQLDVGWSQDGYAWAIDRDGVNGTRENPWCVGSGLPYNPKRDGAYVLVGTAVLVLTDSLYSNAGVGSHCWSPPRLRRCAESTPGVFAVVRVFAALFGSVLLWLGWYNLVNNDLCFTQLVRRIPTVGQYLRFKFQLLLSVVLLAATSTFFAVSGVDVPAAESLATGEAQHSSLLGAVDSVNVALDKVNSDSALPAQAEAFVRATVTIFAQTLLFSGAYGALETECWVEPCDGNVWREMFYCATGLALFFTADAFLSNSLVETGDEEQRPTSSGERDAESRGRHRERSCRASLARQPRVAVQRGADRGSDAQHRRVDDIRSVPLPTLGDLQQPGRCIDSSGLLSGSQLRADGGRGAAAVCIRHIVQQRQCLPAGDAASPLASQQRGRAETKKGAATCSAEACSQARPYRVEHGPHAGDQGEGAWCGEESGACRLPAVGAVAVGDQWPS